MDYVDILVSIWTTTINMHMSSHDNYIPCAVNMCDQVAGVIEPGPTQIWPGRPGVQVHIIEVGVTTVMGGAASCKVELMRVFQN